MNYTELQTTTNFSFLRGASHPEEMVEQAATFGYTAIAITDRNTLDGIVRYSPSAPLTEDVEVSWENTSPFMSSL